MTEPNELSAQAATDAPIEYADLDVSIDIFESNYYGMNYYEPGTLFFPPTWLVDRWDNGHGQRYERERTWQPKTYGPEFITVLNAQLAAIPEGPEYDPYRASFAIYVQELIRVWDGFHNPVDYSDLP